MPDTQDDINRLREQVKVDVESLKGTEKEGLIEPKLFEISALTGQGLRELNLAIASKVKEIKSKLAQSEDKQEQYEKV